LLMYSRRKRINSRSIVERVLRDGFVML
jgi:hypothetical protein